MKLVGRLEFLISDPLSEPNVIAGIPSGMDIVDLADVPYRAQPQIRCALCANHQWHNDGYFAVLADGCMVPCGNCCAARLDPVKKQTIDRRRHELRRQESARKRAALLASDVDSMEEVAAAAERVAGATATDAYFLQQALDLGAINAMASYGVKGVDFIYGCRARLELVRKACVAIRRLHAVSESDYERFSTAKRDAWAELRSAKEYILCCVAFFEPSNLELAQGWAKVEGENFGLSQFEVKKGKLCVKSPTVFKNIAIPDFAIPRSVYDLDSGIKD